MGHLEYSWLFVKRHERLFLYKHRLEEEERLERKQREAAETSRFRTEARAGRLGSTHSLASMRAGVIAAAAAVAAAAADTDDQKRLSEEVDENGEEA